jgi:hypothetical protein
MNSLGRMTDALNVVQILFHELQLGIKSMEYIPDHWVILNIQDEFHKVLAGWDGSYTNGSSWQINSGITRVEDQGDLLHFYGESGSCYICHKAKEGFNPIMSDIYCKITNKFKDGVEAISYEEYLVQNPREQDF